MGKSLLEETLNLPLAQHAVEDYRKATGVNACIIDIDGRYYSDSSQQTTCAFCSTLQNRFGLKDTCMHSHLYGSYQAERFGGKYIYFCPIGLVHWASPLFHEEIMIGALIGGPVLMVEYEEYFREEYPSQFQLTEEDSQMLWTQLKEIPFKPPEVVTSLSELLFMLSVYISGLKPAEFMDDRERLTQQSNISAYIHYLKSMGGDESLITGYPLKKERELMKLITLGDKEGSRKLLNELLGHVFVASGGKIDIVKARILELVVLLSRAAMEGGADVEQIFGLNYNYLNQIHKLNTVEDLSFWVSRIMGRFTDLVFDLRDVKHIDVLHKAMDYIKRNYHRKITLKDVAEYVKLSASYFSRLFKTEMAMTFTHYLNRVRIEQSKSLLLNESIPLVDIALLTGFEDQSYFTKVFRKHVGISPGKFRAFRGQIPRNPHIHKE
ncbi:MAG: PocR ligand-binding domain-containing protein [Spirochaetes bacterium]|nr:PocR ligand-binding domain-containing protein [Spirochaetota bacterium]